VIREVVWPSVVLVYHGVGEATDADDPNRLLTSPQNFERQLEFLSRRGYSFATAEQLLEQAPNAQTAVLTFDDGWRNWESEAAELLERFGVPATFYVCPGLWGQTHPDVRGGAGALMDAEAAGALHARGFELGAHSLTHRDLRLLHDAALEEEIRGSKLQVEAITGRPCRTFAYPFGLYDDRVVAAVARAGYELAFGWLEGVWPLTTPRLPAPPRHGALKLGAKLLRLRASRNGRGLDDRA
jgi:peptidoglycan/xylan/chitin deacetylase (PgdA/CDA1 family)